MLGRRTPHGVMVILKDYLHKHKRNNFQYDLWDGGSTPHGIHNRLRENITHRQKTKHGGFRSKSGHAWWKKRSCILTISILKGNHGEVLQSTHSGRAFKIGDWMLMKTEESQQEFNDKLGKTWERPYRVVEVIENGVYILETPEGNLIPRT